MKLKPPSSGLDVQALTGAAVPPQARPSNPSQRRNMVIAIMPEHPPCWSRQEDWAEYVVQADASTKSNDGERPLRLVHGKPTFNVRWSYCTDCMPLHAAEMARQGRCQPNAVKQRLSSGSAVAEASA